MQLKMLFGKKLKYLLEKQNISFTEFSKKSGINRDHIYHIIDGSKEIGIDTIDRVCISLNLPVKNLFDFSPILETNNVDELVLSDFNSLPDRYWDFKNVKTDALIHTIHPYPAVMIYPISRTIIDIVSKYKDISCLLDPFEGSGTVIVEGQLHGLKKVIGNDLNPLANLISTAKTTILTAKDIKDICCLSDEINDLNKLFSDKMKEFANYITNNYQIDEKGEWSENATSIIYDYFKETNLHKYCNFPKMTNLGFWFRPETILPIFIIKKLIKDSKNDRIKPFLLCTLSEVIRFVSNTRNSEFKLYRVKREKLLSAYFNVFEIFSSTLKRNLKKEEEFIVANSHNSPSQVVHTLNDSRKLNDIENLCADIVITSPPYGDSHTTVAYGQFSKLSNDILELTTEKNVDSILLGGKRVENKTVNFLGSETLTSIINEINNIDQKRANEVLDFYFDLDASIKTITKKTKPFGYQFWVVGNRTVKKINIPTDIILEELAKKYGLKCLQRYYRSISNKVMPSSNSPTNKVGDTVNTMSDEIIVFFKKEY